MAFSASRPAACCESCVCPSILKKNLKSLSSIIFESISLNLGASFDPDTGVFTAPRDGVYSFSWSALSSTLFDAQTTGILRIQLMVNGDPVAGSVGTRTTSGNKLIILRNGDTVSLEVEKGHQREELKERADQTVFNGFMI